MSVVLLLFAGVVICLTVEDYNDHNRSPYGGIVVALLIIMTSSCGFYGIINESYNWGARDHFLGKVDVKIREASTTRKNVIYIEEGMQ